MSIELKPCPFCGKSETVHCDTKTFCTVTCVPSEGGCGGSTGLFCTESEAVEAWNSRIFDD